jgi:hypothetical protein
MSNTDPITYRGWTRVLSKVKQFLPFTRHSPYYSSHIYVLSSVLWCPLLFPYKNDIRFVLTPSCLMMSYLWCLCIMVSNTSWKWQSRMDNPEKRATLSTHYTGWRQPKQKTKHRKLKRLVTRAPSHTRGELGCRLQACMAICLLSGSFLHFPTRVRTTAAHIKSSLIACCKSNFLFLAIVMDHIRISCTGLSLVYIKPASR